MHSVMTPSWQRKWKFEGWMCWCVCIFLNKVSYSIGWSGLGKITHLKIVLKKPLLLFGWFENITEIITTNLSSQLSSNSSEHASENSVPSPSRPTQKSNELPRRSAWRNLGIGIRTLKPFGKNDEKARETCQKQWKKVDSHVDYRCTSYTIQNPGHLSGVLCAAVPILLSLLLFPSETKGFRSTSFYISHNPCWGPKQVNSKRTRSHPSLGPTLKHWKHLHVPSSMLRCTHLSPQKPTF